MTIERSVMKNFKLTPAEWDQYGRIRFHWPGPSDFSSVCRKGLELMLSMCEPAELNNVALVVNDLAYSRAKRLLEEMQTPPKTATPIETPSEREGAAGGATPAPKKRPRPKKLKPHANGKTRPAKQKGGKT